MTNKEDIIGKLNTLRAFAAILDTLHQPLEQMMQDRKCSQDEAIQYKEKADNYLRKCGATVIRRTITEVTQLIK